MIYTKTLPEFWGTLYHAQREYEREIIDRHELTSTVNEIVRTCEFLATLPDGWKQRIVARLNKFALRKQLSMVG